MNLSSDRTAFAPHPLLNNGHVQTLVGSFWKSKSSKFRLRKHVLPTSEDDCLVADEFECDAQFQDPLALLFHGLTGTSQSSYIKRLVPQLVAAGFRPISVNARGCGAGAAYARAHSHAGRAEDVDAAVAFFAKMFPAAKIHLIGYSLAANTIMLANGKWGTKPPAAVQSLVAVSPPVDLIECSAQLRTGLSRFYDYYFTKVLLKQIRRRRQCNPQMLDSLLSDQVETLLDFDSGFTAPLSGFPTVEDYYWESSARRFWSEATVPSWVLHADDDPVVPLSAFQRLPSNRKIDFKITRYGGHLGYFSAQKSSGSRWWMDQQIIARLKVFKKRTED